CEKIACYWVAGAVDQCFQSPRFTANAGIVEEHLRFSFCRTTKGPADCLWVKVQPGDSRRSVSHLSFNPSREAGSKALFGHGGLLDGAGRQQRIIVTFVHQTLSQ